MQFVVCPSGARSFEDQYIRCSQPMQLKTTALDSDYLHFCPSTFEPAINHQIACDSNQLMTLAEVKRLGSGYVLQLPSDAYDLDSGELIRTPHNKGSYDVALMVESSTGVTESPLQMTFGAVSAFLLFGAFAAAVLRNI